MMSAVPQTRLGPPLVFPPTRVRLCRLRFARLAGRVSLGQFVTKLR
jgi:hypothetical protein